MDVGEIVNSTQNPVAQALHYILCNVFFVPSFAAEIQGSTK